MLTLRGHRGRPNNKPRSEVADVNLFLSKKGPTRTERYRVFSTGAQTTAIDQTAGLVILTIEPCRFVFRPGPANEEAEVAPAFSQPIG